VQGYPECVLNIGVVGDYVGTYEPHLATDASVGHAAADLGFSARTHWLGTEQVALQKDSVLHGHDGLIIAPGSPYRSQAGALEAIRFARLQNVPLLGTCGGFQHVVLEFARNVLGFTDAEHAEYDPYASRLFVSPLSCSVAGQRMTVHLLPDSQAAMAYGSEMAAEDYYCNFGLNLEYLDAITKAGLKVTGTDQDGEPRILELPNLRYFVATLFVPQTSSPVGKPHPIIRSFIAGANEQSSPQNTTPDPPRLSSEP
jgi:CTP synthase (UTP-ammonia lyase)